MIDIKDIHGNIRFSTPINVGSKRKFMLMKDDFVTLKFSLDKPLFFKLGDGIDDEIGLFELCDLYKPTYNKESGGYDYELRLDAYYWKWKNKIFKFTPEALGKEASWNLTASLDIQMGIFLRNLKALGYTYRGKDFEFSIDDTVENKAMPMTYDNMNMIDALTRMAETWNCEWWVIEHTIHFGRCEQGNPIDFEVGKNVEEMAGTDSQASYATRIYAFGSTKNLPPDYRPIDENVVVNGVVQRRLMLPASMPYIDAYEGMQAEDAIEQVVVFDDIYPRRIGTISGVEAMEESETDVVTGEKIKYKAYAFKDTDFTFSDEYMLEGQDLQIVFQSGKLDGLNFKVKFNPDNKPLKNDDGTWNSEAQLFKIVRNDDYGRMLPDNLLIPAIGDRYILYGWDATKIAELGLVSKAEQELETRAKEYVNKVKTDPSTYNNKMMSDYMFGVNPITGELDENYSKRFKAGDRVNLINAASFESGSRQSRIIGFEYNLDMPYENPVYIVGETAPYSRIGELESKVESITYKGFNYTYTTGGGSSSSDSTSVRLKKDIQVTAPKTGYFDTGYVIMAGQTWEDILRKMLYEPVQATLKGSLSTNNDVEYGSPKGSITYTAARNGQGKMTEAYYDNDKKNVLKFSEEVDGVQQAMRRLSGVYTQGESYYATVSYAASENGELPNLILQDKISVNVRRKWFAGAVDSVPTTGAQVRALGSSGLYLGAKDYKFSIGEWTTMVICIPSGNIESVMKEKTPGNYLKSRGVYKGMRQISVEGANNSMAVDYSMYIFAVDTKSDETSFSFSTI